MDSVYLSKGGTDLELRTQQMFMAILPTCSVFESSGVVSPVLACFDLIISPSLITTSRCARIQSIQNLCIHLSTCNCVIYCVEKATGTERFNTYKIHLSQWVVIEADGAFNLIAHLFLLLFLSFSFFSHLSLQFQGCSVIFNYG